MQFWRSFRLPQCELVDSGKETLCVLEIGKRLHKHVALVQDLQKKKQQLH